MCKTNCRCAPEVPDLGEAIRASRRAETVEQRVQRLTGSFKTALTPVTAAPRAAAATATVPSPDWTAAIRAARQ